MSQHALERDVCVPDGEAVGNEEVEAAKGGDGRDEETDADRNLDTDQVRNKRQFVSNPND